MSRFNRQKNITEDQNDVEGSAVEASPQSVSNTPAVPEMEMEMEMSVSEKESFRRNYDILRNAVSELQNGDIEHIDDLLPLIDKASQAYRACVERIDAVSRLVEEEFEDKDLQI